MDLLVVITTKKKRNFLKNNTAHAALGQIESNDITTYNLQIRN